MQPIKNLFGGLVILGGFIGSLSLLHAQEATDLETIAPVSSGTLALTPTDVASFSSLSDAQLAALLSDLDANPTYAVEAGTSGTFYSLQHPEWAPLPVDLSGISVWDCGTFFLLSDLNYNYAAAEKRSLAARSRIMVPAMDGFQAQTFTTNELWLQFAGQSNAVSALVIHPPTTIPGSNFVFDVFATTNLQANGPGLNLTNWLLVTRSAPGQTNLTAAPLSNAPVCFYRLGTLQDSDDDGLSDAFEKLVSHTNPALWDSNGNGIGDGDEIRPGGLPWRLEAVRASSAVIYANSPVATQGGACGQCTVYLPGPAPVGGTLVQYYLGGTAILNTDFTLTPAASQLLIPAGYSSGVLTVCAGGGSTYSDIPLDADITLTNAGNFPVDSTPAEVRIVDTGLPGVRVFALPPWVRRPCPTYGTNGAGFYFIRDGDSPNALTVGLSTTGSTAAAGPDYTGLPATITFSANVRTNWLPLTITPNSTNTTDKILVLTLTSTPGYQIDPASGAATVTIAATAAPVLPVVQVAATDVDATPASPGQFTFTRSLVTTNALRIFYHVWGDTNTVIARTNGQDTTLYTGLPGYVDIPAGATNVTTAVTASQPIATSQPVTVILASGDYAIGANNSATVYVDGAGAFNVGAVVTREGIYGNPAQAAEVTLTRYGSTLAAQTINWSLVNPYIGPVVQGLHSGQFTWAPHQSVLKVQLNPSWSYYTDPSVQPTLILSNALIIKNIAVQYYQPSALFTISGAYSPANTVTEGSTINLSVGRPHPNSSAVSVNLTLSGSAVNGTDFSCSTLVNFGVNQTAVMVPLQAFNNALPQGWRTAVVTVGHHSSQVGQINLDRTFVRIQDPQNATADTDLDGDGLADGYELAHGQDTTVPDNPYVDDDRDGLSLEEELDLGTNPNAPDAPPIYPSIEPTDFVPLTMRVGSVGKMLQEPGLNCAACHSVTLRAGNFIRSCRKTDWTHNPTTSDSLIRFLRGTNYPVSVTCQPYYSALLTSNQMVTVNQSRPAGSPHYTAGYNAQFLTDTNNDTPYPFIVDPDGLLGMNRSLVQETLPERATLYIPDLTIAADNDRDGTVDFRSRNDRTATNNPFAFWINDDADTGNDDAAGDQQPTNSPSNLNCANSTIDGLRDLEDFARLQFKIDGLPAQFLNSYQVKIYLTNLVGSPSLRLFPAADENGGLGYLTNTATATTQAAKTMLGVVTNGTPLTLASNNWLAAGANNFLLPMIFEGVSTGSCVIAFGFSTNNGPPVAMSRPFYLTLKRVTDLYEHWTVGDNNTMDWHDIPRYPTLTADSGVFAKPQKESDLDYVLFVHGWRMQPWERRAFASTAFKRLWHLGYRGRFGLYSWPTDYTGTSFWDMLDPLNPTVALANRQNYDRSEQRAWKSGTGLFELLAALNSHESPYRVRLLAHSMGNIVASEALRQAGVAGGNPLVQGYVASQAATVAHAYDAVNPAYVLFAPLLRTPEIYAHFPRNDTTQPYFTGMKNAVQGNRIVNFNNRVDYALNSTFAWPANQSFKPVFGWSCLLTGTNTTHNYWDHNTRLKLNGQEAEPDSTYNIFAHIAQAESKALGSAEDDTHHVHGEIGSSVNLNGPPFNFGNKDYEHSAEFNSINMNRRFYWWQVLSTFSLTNNLPKP